MKREKAGKGMGKEEKPASTILAQFYPIVADPVRLPK